MPLPTLEELEPRDCPTPLVFDYDKIPRGEQELLKKILRDAERLLTVRPIQAPAKVAGGVVRPTSASSPPRHPPYIVVQQMTHADGHTEMEVSLMVFDPQIALYLSAYQAKKLDDLFAEQMRYGARDTRSGRFVGFLVPPKHHRYCLPLLRMEHSSVGHPMLEAVVTMESKETPAGPGERLVGYGAEKR